MDIDESTVLPSNYLPCKVCGVVLILLVAGGLFCIGIPALIARGMFLHQNGPLFSLQSVSVTVPSFNSSSNDLQSEWFLKFQVDYDCISTSLTYQHINVFVHCLTGNSTVAVIHPNTRAESLTAIVHAPLPSFNATYVELSSFDVHVEAALKYKNWLHIYPLKHRDGRTNATCKDVRIGIYSDNMHGTLVGGPYRCYDD